MSAIDLTHTSQQIFQYFIKFRHLKRNQGRRRRGSMPAWEPCFSCPLHMKNNKQVLIGRALQFRILTRSPNSYSSYFSSFPVSQQPCQLQWEWHGKSSAEREREKERKRPGVRYTINLWLSKLSGIQSLNFHWIGRWLLSIPGFQGPLPLHV